MRLASSMVCSSFFVIGYRSAARKPVFRRIQRVMKTVK
jgi:hypothetical protein